MYYDKRIRYLNYYESGIKLQNAGYVKFQVRDHVCQMIISVRGPRLMGSGESKVYLLSEACEEKKEKKNIFSGKLLGTIGIRNGQGYCAVRLDADDMGDTGLRYDEVTGIRIVLREHQFLESQWFVVNIMPWKRDINQKDVLVNDTANNKEEDEKNSVMEAEKAKITESAESQTLEEEICINELEEVKPDVLDKVQSANQELKADKWEQLRETFPIIHPIREEEECLKIEPKDFVIFTEKYQELVHNSFLLHGYYNYKHLLLGKKEKEGKPVYYLGVPGSFHEREKKVALMFGFEAFDGKREPAETGDFGYYLKRVEL